MVSLSFEKASLLFPMGRRKPTGKNGVGANFVERGGKYFIASVKGVDLDLRDGERVALIGQNGSGKSSLLRLGAGIYAPTEGTVRIVGKPGALFSTSSGLSVEASAVQNIRDGAALLNIPRAEVDDLVEEVIDFAELGKFAHMPMRIYSSGMRARVGFGLVTSKFADILLIDEVFGTGDSKFYGKAKQRLEKRMEQSALLMLASHSERIVKSFCSKALWMHQGEVQAFGPIEQVYSAYQQFLESRTD